jgi:hypothetical protein
MTEVFEHNLGDHEDPLPGPTWIVTFVGAVLLTVIILGLTALLYNAQEQEDEVKLIQRDPEELASLRDQHLAQITGEPRWVEETVTVEGSQQEQKVQALVIPIDQAMQLVVKEAGGQ